jgi:[acyl-carrier-protein] S-malonyltransferase
MGNGDCENKPGHRALETYDLPSWVRHPLKPEVLKVAALFPGEQNHNVGMLKDVRKKPVVRDMLEKAEQVFGFDVEELMKDGPASKMKPTGVNQPLMYVADCAAWELFMEKAPEIACNLQGMAGFSVGEYAALYAAGVITFEMGLEIVKARADAMQELADEVEMEGLSIRGVPLDKLERSLKSAEKMDKESGGEPGVYIARYWCPNGVICAGKASTVLALKSIVERESKGGAEVRLMPDHMHAGHTPLAQEAGTKVAAVIDKFLPAMMPPWCELYLNSTGYKVVPGADPESFADALKDQLSKPVQWSECITQMLNFGVSQFWECGPSRSIKFMLGYYEHKFEGPLETVKKPSEFTNNVTV